MMVKIGDLVEFYTPEGVRRGKILAKPQQPAGTYFVAIPHVGNAENQTDKYDTAYILIGECRLALTKGMMTKARYRWWRANG